MKRRYINNNQKIVIVCIVLLFFAACKVPYDPPIKSSGAHYLVVEGYINSNGVPTNIKLSRTRNVTWGDTAAYINETGAHVVIEDNQNNQYPLYETGAGNYSGVYNLNTSDKYRLDITTNDQKEYVSEFVSCKISPPIDTVGWKFKDGDVQVFVNTHDPANNTTFYRWDYKETWEFHSEYYSYLVFDSASQKVVNRSVPVFVCYRSQNSSNIFLGSTARLQQDVIHEAPLALIPDHDRRISVLYSTLVTQYALDSAAYNYWNAMKGNTENVGSVFDSQPNLTVGNIHCVSDPSEKVIGYIGVGSTQQQRLFISNSEMMPGWNQPGNCTQVLVPPDSVVFYFGDKIYIPFQTDPPNSIMPTGYFGASASCVDCTLTGTPVKPSFWR